MARAPGSVREWALVEGEDQKALYGHLAQWANLLDLETDPVLEDSEAAEALSRVYGKWCSNIWSNKYMEAMSDPLHGSAARISSAASAVKRGIIYTQHQLRQTNS